MGRKPGKEVEVRYILILEVHGSVFWGEFAEMDSLNQTLTKWLEREKQNYPHAVFTPKIYQAKRVGGA